jgi:prefoldin subunit 5
MKKGLLTVLLASLVLVGCQNYDDQFDDLNAQISALKSQVDGLSSLSAQVSSLSGTISGLQSGIAAATAAASAAGTAATAAGASADAATAAASANATSIAAATAAATAAGTAATAAGASADAATAAATAAASATDLTALSTSLTALAADVAAVQASLATAATAEAVTALQAEIDAIEADLDELLASSNVYATAIDIDSAADMAAALALGNKVALMNSTVNIEDSATIADADIQTFVDRIATMNGAFTYSSMSATGFVPTFDNMVSAKAITITAAGDISFAKLASATDIVIHDDYESKITSLSMPLLASVDGIDMDENGSAVTDAVKLDSATNIDLGSLARYGSAFTVNMKEGGTLDIASLDDVNTLGKQADLALTISGPASLSLTKIEGGALSLTNVATATVSGLYSNITVGAGVETLTVTKGVNVDLSGADDLETATLNLVNSYDADFTTVEAAAAAKGNSSTYTGSMTTIDAPQLTSLTMTGNWLDLTINSGESNLTTLSIDGTFDDLSIIGAADLTTLTISDDTAFGDLTLQSNPNLVVADFDHSFSGAQQATAATSATVSVTGNASLEKFHYAADDVSSLTVTGNAKLAELDLTGLADDGASTATVAYIYDNNLTATSSTNSKDSDTAVAAGTDGDGESGDSGSFDNGTSGMKTAQAYLDHIALQAAAKAYVTFDKVSTLTNSESGSDVVSLNVEPSASGKLVTSAAANATTVLMMVPQVANSTPSNGVAATKGKRALAPTTGGNLQFTINGVNVPATAYALTGNGAVDALNLASQANKDLASAAGITFDVVHAYAASAKIVLSEIANNATTDATERYTDAEVAAAATATGSLWTVGIEDEFTLSVNGTANTVTVTPGGISGSATDLAGLEAMFISAWEDKYGSTGTASLSALATIVNDGGNAGGTFVVKSLQPDSGGNGLSVSLSIKDKTQATGNATRTSGNIGVVIGATAATNDNVTIPTTAGGGIIATFESKLEGLTDSILTGVDTTTGNATMASLTELTSAYKAETGVTSYALAQDPRTDARKVWASVADTSVSNAEAAIAFDRTAWLG